jgi:transcriptional regulator with XRE-family HTH domain
MTITNARQYRVTKAQLLRFEQAMASPEGDLGRPMTGTEWTVDDALREQARRQADELRAQLEEYERVSGSKTMTLEVHSLADLPSALVHARLASGLTQKALAEQLGVTPQQVQRDEQTGYAHASLDRLERVWNLLGARLDGQVTISPQLDSAHDSSSEQGEAELPIPGSGRAVHETHLSER